MATTRAGTSLMLLLIKVLFVGVAGVVVVVTSFEFVEVGEI